MEEEEINCRDFFDYESIPPRDFLFEYYELAQSEFQGVNLGDCDCNEYKAIQTFKNQNLGNYWPNYMAMYPTCEEMLSQCNIEETQLLQNVQVILDSMLEIRAFSIQEHSILNSFFEEFITQGSVNFDEYWCQLANADYSGIVDPNFPGYAGAVTLTMFETPFNNNNGSTINTRIRNWFLAGLAWDFAKKYGGAMYICGEGLYNNQCTANEAFDYFMD